MILYLLNPGTLIGIDGFVGSRFCTNRSFGVDVLPLSLPRPPSRVSHLSGECVTYPRASFRIHVSYVEAHDSYAGLHAGRP